MTSGWTTGVDRRPKVAEAVSFSTLALGLVMKYDQEEPSIQNGSLDSLVERCGKMLKTSHDQSWNSDAVFRQTSLSDSDHGDFKTDSALLHRRRSGAC